MAGAVFLAGFSAMFLFAGYEFIRSPAESIFIEQFGAGSKPYAIACVPFMMAAMIYGYGRLLSSVGAKKAMAVSMLGSAAFFVVAWALLGHAGRWLAFLLLVFKESYVVIISEQYWSFINSVLKDEEGKVFNGPVAGLGALGSLTGGWLLGRYAVGYGTEVFVLLSALLILPAVWLFWAGYGKAGEPKPSAEEAGGRKGHLHLGILKENRTVLFIAFIIFAAQVVATALDFRFTQLVQDNMPLKDARTAYLGNFWMQVNIFSFSMQFLATPLLLRYIPRRGILTAIPAVHIVTCALLLLYPSLWLGGLDRLPAVQGHGLFHLQGFEGDALYPVLLRHTLPRQASGRRLHLPFRQGPDGHLGVGAAGAGHHSAQLLPGAGGYLLRGLAGHVLPADG